MKAIVKAIKENYEEYFNDIVIVAFIIHCFDIATI